MRRLEGGGRKTLYPEVNVALLDNFKDEKTQSRAITYKMLQNFV
jgi:hypothetical protein